MMYELKDSYFIMVDLPVLIIGGAAVVAAAGFLVYRLRKN